MVTVSFPNWSDALAAADLPDKVRGRHRVIIYGRIYLHVMEAQADLVASPLDGLSAECAAA